MKASLLAVREAPQGFGEDVLALVDFKAEGSSLAPVTVNRYVKSKDTAYPFLRVAAPGPFVIEYLGAQLRESAKGPWLALNNVDLPDVNLKELAADALAELKAMRSRGESARPGARR